MKRAAAVRGPDEDEKENGRSESNVMNKEPPVKKTAVEPAPSSEVAKLQDKLFQSDTKLQHMCKMDLKSQGMIEDLRARVKFLENLIDTKEGILENANKASGSVEEELKKKVNDLKEELVESQLQAAQQRAEDSATVCELTKKLEEERQKSAGLHEKLENVADLEKKVKVLETDLKEANNQRALSFLNSKIGMNKLAADKELLRQLGIQQKRKLGEQASQLEEERKLSAELKQKLANFGDKFRSASADFESIAATLASVDVPTSLANLVSPSPLIPPRPSNAASTQQKASSAMRMSLHPPTPPRSLVAASMRLSLHPPTPLRSSVAASTQQKSAVLESVNSVNARRASDRSNWPPFRASDYSSLGRRTIQLASTPKTAAAEKKTPSTNLVSTPAPKLPQKAASTQKKLHAPATGAKPAVKPKASKVVISSSDDSSTDDDDN